MKPADWMVRWSDGKEPGPAHMSLRSILSGAEGDPRTFRFHLSQYLFRRAQDWKARGFTETVVDFHTLNARSKFWGDDQRAAFINWEETGDLRNPLWRTAEHRRHGAATRAAQSRRDEGDVREQARCARAAPLGAAARQDRRTARAESQRTGDFIPARTECRVDGDPDSGRLRADGVRPAFVLTTDANGRKIYRSRTGTTPITLPAPGLPFSINFLTEPGMEQLSIKAATAYQSASHRRVPPPMFPPLKNEP